MTVTTYWFLNELGIVSINGLDYWIIYSLRVSNRWVLMKMDVWETNVLQSAVTRWMIWIFSAWAGESHHWADDIWDEPHEKGANALDPAEPLWQLENKLPVEISAISAHVTAVSISSPFIHATAAWTCFFKTFSRRQWLSPNTFCLTYYFFWVLCSKPKFEQYS